MKKLILQWLHKCGYDLVKVKQQMDPLSDTGFQLESYRMLAPAGHDFFSNYQTFPLYQRNLQRLVSFLYKIDKELKIIDVGANIGDTALLIQLAEKVPVLCVEGEKKFFPYLEKNTIQFQRVAIEKTFLGADGQNQTDLSREYHLGTMRLVTKGTGEGVAFSTLDKVLEKRPEFSDAPLLKIDTDGYDYFVLRGASLYLKKQQPVLFFEYDRTFMENNGISGMELFDYLKQLAYSDVLVYDNFGRFLLSAELSNEQLLRQLHAYVGAQNHTFPYYDLCVFPKTRLVHFAAFLREEMETLAPGPLNSEI